MKIIRENLLRGLIAIVIFGFITGVVYPLVVTGISQLAFPSQANGSIIYNGKVAIGSELIGQQFDDPKYFWGRPSATSPDPYNSSLSSGSNYGPLSPSLIDKVNERIKKLKEYEPDNKLPVPIDLVTSSGSGLDPHISIAAAYYQVPRVAKYRNISQNTLCSMIDESVERRQLGILGEPRINVLKLNLVLDKLNK